MAKKLIIIDDSMTQLNILKNFFQNNNWDVCAVQSARLALEIVYNYAPDLIITDAIMPSMGGFQFVKLIRENKEISKIPIIVYSVLNEGNIKKFLNDELSEYLSKSDNNVEDLLTVANKMVHNFPMSKEYKQNILQKMYSINNNENVEKQEEQPEKIEKSSEMLENVEEKFDISIFKQNIAEKFRTIDDDNKLYSEIFNVLHKTFQYDIGILSIKPSEHKPKELYFDIRGVILSPILKDFIMNKHNVKTSVMFKKYAPNMKIISSINDFSSEVEFSFDYKDKDIAYITLSFLKNNLMKNETNISQVKEVLYEFFKKRYIEKNIQIAKKENKNIKYSRNDNFEKYKNIDEPYFAIIQIYNFNDVTRYMTENETDILHSKITEKVIESLEKNDYAYRNYSGEYNIVFSAKDEKKARYKMNYIKELLNKIVCDDENLKVKIYAVNCNINENINIEQAQKIAQELVSNNSKEEVVIYNAR